AEQRAEHVGRRERDRADEDPRGHAHREQDREDRDRGRGPGHLKSSGWTSFANSSAASPTRGPGRLNRLSPGYTRLFFTALSAAHPGLLATESTVVPYSASSRTMTSGSAFTISSVEIVG